MRARQSRRRSGLSQTRPSDNRRVYKFVRFFEITEGQSFVEYTAEDLGSLDFVTGDASYRPAKLQKVRANFTLYAASSPPVQAYTTLYGDADTSLKMSCVSQPKLVTFARSVTTTLTQRASVQFKDIEKTAPLFRFHFNTFGVPTTPVSMVVQFTCTFMIGREQPDIITSSSSTTRTGPETRRMADQGTKPLPPMEKTRPLYVPTPPHQN